jgi:hypothetical protein
MDPLARLLELDERCRQVLHSRDLSMRREFAEIQLEIDRLRIRHPSILDKLERLYRAAHPGRLDTTGRLIDFALQQNLRLTGEPYSGKADSA